MEDVVLRTAVDNVPENQMYFYWSNQAAASQSAKADCHLQVVDVVYFLIRPRPFRASRPGARPFGAGIGGAGRHRASGSTLLRHDFFNMYL